MTEHRERCPDCDGILKNFYYQKMADGKQKMTIKGKFCPSCFFTKYVDSESGGTMLILSPKRIEEKDRNRKLNYLDVLKPIGKIDSNFMNVLTSELKSPKNLKEFKETVKAEYEILEILRRMSGKDEEVYRMVSNGASSTEIKVFVALRDLKWYSEDQINDALKSLKYDKYEGLDYSAKLNRLVQTDDYVQVIKYPRKNYQATS